MASIEGKLLKAYKDMKSLYGMPKAKVEASLSRLLRLYGDEWGFIEENNYQVLFECCMMEDEQEQEQEEQQKEQLKFELKTILDDEPKYNSRPLLYDEPSTSKWAKQDEAEALIEVKEPCQLPNKRARASFSETEHGIKGKKPVIAETSSGRALDIVNNEIAIDELSPGELPLAVIHPDTDDTNAVAAVSDATQLELVSSENGEVKLSLIYNSLVKNYTKVPSLDVYIKEAKDEIRKKYGIKDPKFCMKKIMTELCECFLLMGNNVINEPHLLPKFNEPTKLEAQGNTNGKDYDQSNSNTQPNVDDCNGKVANPPFNFPKNPIFVQDITRGEERQPISLVNDNGALELPKLFYISKNTEYKNAYVKFSLARIGDENCCSNYSGDCLSSPANCACTSETRGDFAYTAAGVLQEKFLSESIAIRRKAKEHFYYCENCPLENNLVRSSKIHKRKRSIKPCKGHMMRKFIKECWVKCGCNQNCGNRVVQRGITVKLQVFQTSEGKGWSVRTLETLEKGTFVCEYVGEIVTNQELDKRNKEFFGDRHTYPVLLDADWAYERHLKDEEALCLDATKFGNVPRFINHRCYDANLIEIPVEIETPDHHYYHIAFFTTRKVETNEELNWDYGIDFTDKNHPIKAFDCKCESFFCSMKSEQI